MKKTLLLLMTLTLVYLGHAQHLVGTYTSCFDFVSVRSTIGFEFRFYKNGKFMLILSYTDSSPLFEDEDGTITRDDFIYENIWSYGTYKMDSDNIILSDSIQDCSIRYEIHNKTFLPTSTFTFLENQRLCYSQSDPRDDMPYVCSHNFVFSSEEIELYNKQEKNPLVFRPGIYGNRFEDGFLFRYSFFPNGFYTITWYGQVLSEGRWERENNVLKLTDDHLKYNRYLLIGDGAIISKIVKDVSIPYVSDLE